MADTASMMCTGVKLVGLITILDISGRCLIPPAALLHPFEEQAITS